MSNPLGLWLSDSCSIFPACVLKNSIPAVCTKEYTLFSLRCEERHETSYLTWSMTTSYIYISKFTCTLISIFLRENIILNISLNLTSLTKPKIYWREECKPFCSCVSPVLHKVRVIIHARVASILSYAKK